MTVILGVTGSRVQRPQKVVDIFRQILADYGATELHHGDCVGWDEQAFNVARDMNVKTVSHPPVVSTYRAFTDSDVVMPVAGYLDRNKNIVRAVSFLIAAPDGPERQRSGTWSTVRFAKSIGVNGVILNGKAASKSV